MVFPMLNYGHTQETRLQLDDGYIVVRKGTAADNGGTVWRDALGRSWVRDFSGNVNVKWFGASGNGFDEDTLPINRAFIDAAERQTGVYVPAGTYLVGALLFGTQNVTGGQSGAPQGLYGDGWTTSFKAKPGFTGTVLQAWSTAGMEFSDFQVDGSDTAARCIDTDWKLGIGPSVQNRYTRVRVLGATGTVWSAIDNNDCVFDQVVSLAAGPDKCALDFVAPGGLGWLRDCIWNTGYLRFGVQNGAISNSWGAGIMFAQSCLNYVALNGCYLYGNSHLGGVLKSESFANFQSVHALKCTATQFISNGTTSYFNLNAYSVLDFDSCQWVGTATNMFGVNCRKDSYAKVKVLFRGGSLPDFLAVNQPAGFIIEQDGLIDENTGYNRPNKKSSVYAQGTLSANYISGTFYDLIPASTLEEGTYLIELHWNHNGAGQPFIIKASAIVPVLDQDSGAVAGPALAANTSTYFTNDGGVVSFRLVGTGAGQKVQFRWVAGAFSGNLNNPGVINWKAVKIC